MGKKKWNAFRWPIIKTVRKLANDAASPDGWLAKRLENPSVADADAIKAFIAEAFGLEPDAIPMGWTSMMDELAAAMEEMTKGIRGYLDWSGPAPTLDLARPTAAGMSMSDASHLTEMMRTPAQPREEAQPEPTPEPTPELAPEPTPEPTPTEQVAEQPVAEEQPAEQPQEPAQPKSEWEERDDLDADLEEPFDAEETEGAWRPRAYGKPGMENANGEVAYDWKEENGLLVAEEDGETISGGRENFQDEADEALGNITEALPSVEGNVVYLQTGPLEPGKAPTKLVVFGESAQTIAGAMDAANVTYRDNFDSIDEKMEEGKETRDGDAYDESHYKVTISGKKNVQAAIQALVGDNGDYGAAVLQDEGGSIRIMLNPKSVDMEGVTTLAQAQAANEQLKQDIEERNRQAIAAWEARTGLKYDPEWREHIVRPDGPFREVDGSTIREGTIRNGEWDGEVREYRDGVLRKTAIYKNGSETGTRKLYRGDGTLALDRFFNEDGNAVEIHYGKDGKTEEYRLVLGKRKVLFDSRKQQAEQPQEEPAETVAQPATAAKESWEDKSMEAIVQDIRTIRATPRADHTSPLLKPGATQQKDGTVLHVEPENGGRDVRVYRTNKNGKKVGEEKVFRRIWNDAVTDKPEFDDFLTLHESTRYDDNGNPVEILSYAPDGRIHGRERFRSWFGEDGYWHVASIDHFSVDEDGVYIGREGKTTDVLPLDVLDESRGQPANTALSISGLYTSSPVAYGKPSLHAIGSGLGSRVFGWGLYTSDNRIMVERVYSKLLRENLDDDARPSILEQVWWDNRPEDDKTHLLPYFDVITGETRKFVNEAIEGIASDYALDDDAVSRYFGEDWQTRDMTGQEFYDLVTQVIGENLFSFDISPEQAASQALAYYDIDGIVYPVGVDRVEAGYEGNNYVAFSDEHLRVVGIEEWNPETGRFEKRAPFNTALSVGGFGLNANARAEMEKVRKQYEGTDKWMKAPNGKPTKLNERQWLQVRTPSFKAWFGDWENDPANASKVVDENGEPLVVYHQTNSKAYINRETGQEWDRITPEERQAWRDRGDWDEHWEEQDFYTFDNTTRGRRSIEMPAFFFSPEYDEYHEYGNRTVAAFLNLRNPASNPEIPNAGVTDTAGEDAMNALMKQGYDGFIRDDDGAVYEINAFRPEQIKSATDNVGTFNPENPDIRLSVGERMGGRAPVVEPGGDVREAGEGALAWLRRKFVHSQTPVFDAVRRVMGVGREPPDALNVEAAAKNVHGKIRARQEMLQRAYLEPLKAILAQPGLDRKRFDDYALALHALERNRMIQERSVVVDPTTGEVVDLGVEAGSGVTNAWAERVIREIQRDPFAAQYKEAANILAEMNRFVLRGAVADGLLTEAQARTWMRLSPHYVPLKSGGAAPGAIHKRATGRFTRPDSVLVNSMRQAYATVRNGELNRVNKTMADWIREYDPNGEQVGGTVPESHKHAKIKMTEPQYVPKGSTAEALLRERGIRLVETEDKGGYWVDTGVLPNALKRVVRESVPQGDDIVTFWENGERKFIRFEGKRGRDGRAENEAARIADALNFKNVLHKEGRFWDAIRGLTRWKANVSTSWNPTFIVRNMGADVFNTANLMMIEGKYAELARTMRNYPAALRTIARLHSLRREAGDSKMERMFARCFCAVFCW